MRVLLLGFDGLSHTFITNNLRHLPAFKGIRDFGTFMKLDCGDGPGTPHCWASIATGCTKEKHGIKDFFVTAPVGDFKRPVTQKDFAVPKMWEWIGVAGKFSLLLHVPMIFPAEVINGWVFECGVMGTIAGGDHSPCKPDSMILVAEKFIPEYKFNRDWNANECGGRMQLEGPSRDLFEFAHDRVFYPKLALSKHLLKELPWDFAFVVETLTDRIGHLYTRNEELMLEHYKRVDRAVGEYLTMASNDWIIFVVSDHGMSPVAEINPQFPRQDGEHDSAGCFFVMGEGVLKQEGEVKIVDVAPTVLRLFGIEVPPYMDGRPVKVTSDVNVEALRGLGYIE